MRPVRHRSIAFALPTKTGEALSAAGPRDCAERDLRLSEPRRVGGNHDVAHHRDLAPAAERKPGDRRNDRLAALRDPFPAAGDKILAIDLRVTLRHHLLDIGAGGECLLVSGQHDGPDRRVVLELVQRRGELADQRGAQRVQRRRPVERDNADRAPPLDEDVLVAGLLSHSLPL